MLIILSVDYFKCWILLVEEVITYHKYEVTNLQTGLNVLNVNANNLTLNGRHFLKLIPTTGKKKIPQRDCIRYNHWQKKLPKNDSRKRSCNRHDTWYYCPDLMMIPQLRFLNPTSSVMSKVDVTNDVGFKKRTLGPPHHHTLLPC